MVAQDPSIEPAEPHPLRTIEEAARMMRIGRSRAYELAHDYLNSGGTAGMPVIVFGPGCFRVPRWALVDLVTTRRVVRRCDAAVPSPGTPVAG
jgi:hypothetical protein